MLPSLLLKKKLNKRENLVKHDEFILILVKTIQFTTLKLNYEERPPS